MQTIKCNLTNKAYNVKKQAKWDDLPYKGLSLFTTIYTDNGIVQLYQSKSFAIYATMPYSVK